MVHAQVRGESMRTRYVGHRRCHLPVAWQPKGGATVLYAERRVESRAYGGPDFAGHASSAVRAGRSVRVQGVNHRCSRAKFAADRLSVLRIDQETSSTTGRRYERGDPRVAIAQPSRHVGGARGQSEGGDRDSERVGNVRFLFEVLRPLGWNSRGPRNR